MSNNYLDDEKLKYENIDIPEELDFMVRKTLKKGRAKRKLNIAYKYGVGIASTFLIFIIIVNTIPTVAYAMSKVPGLKKFIEIVTFDKGFNNALEEGLVKDVNFEEQINGVKLNVNTIAGDWKRLWIGYDVNSDLNYGTIINVVDSNTGEAIPVLITFKGDDEENKYMQIGFNEFVEDFILEINVFDRENEKENVLNDEYIASFKVPIKLESEVFNSPLNEIKLDNNIIKTKIGDLEIVILKSSKTRTTIEYKLKSDEYEIMNFENPRLIDDKGDEYTISPSYISEKDDNKDIKIIELQGEIKGDVRCLKFSFDNLYYARKDNRSIIVDLKNKIVMPNDYNFEFESLIGNQLVLKADKVRSVSFDDIILNNEKKLFSSSGVSCIEGVESDEYYVKAYFELSDTSVDKIELKIQWIMKDKVKGESVELIKRYKLTN